MRKAWKVTALVLCSAMMVTACTPGSQKKEETKKKTESSVPEEKEYQGKLDAVNPTAYNNAEGLHLEKGDYISIIGKGKRSPYWQEVERGVIQAASDINAELGYQGKDKVKVTYNAPSDEENVDEQVNILDEELARYPVALGISIVDEKACKVQFDLAAEGEIPVVAFDSGSDYKGLLATVATENTESAKLVADKLAEQTGGEGEVLIFAHSSKTSTGRERVKGFKQEIRKKYPDMEIAGVYYVDEFEKLKKTVAEEVNAGTWRGSEEMTGETVLPENVTEEDVLNYIFGKHPNIKAVYGTNINSLKTALKGLEQQEGMDSTVVAGYDMDEEVQEALEAGKIDGLLVQNPFGMGYASVIAAARAALNMGNEAFVNTGYTWVTRENLDDPEVKKMLY